MIKVHTSADGRKIAEILQGSVTINEPGEILEIMVEAGYMDCNSMIVYSADLHPDFFDLKTGLAGEIMQKFSNYRMKLAIVGEFSDIKSRSFKDFIKESNTRGMTFFAGSLEEALSGLQRN